MKFTSLTASLAFTAAQLLLLMNFQPLQLFRQNDDGFKLLVGLLFRCQLVGGTEVLLL